jgi:hypothetical protein
MSVFVKAISLYKKEGFAVGTGLNPYHFTPPPPVQDCIWCCPSRQFITL